MAKIDEYIRERVTLADEVIVGFAKEKIRNGDVVLTYARCASVPHVASNDLIADDLLCLQVIGRREGLD